MNFVAKLVFFSEELYFYAHIHLHGVILRLTHCLEGQNPCAGFLPVLSLM